MPTTPPRPAPPRRREPADRTNTGRTARRTGASPPPPRRATPKARPVPAHPLYEPLSDELVWDGRFPVQRVRFRYRRRDGRLSGVLTWELWRRGRAAVMLPWDPDTDRVVLIEQFRLPALAAGYEPLCLECPAGLLEPDEDPAGAATRELAEETGLVADRTEKLTEFMLTQGGADEAAWLYLARVRLDAEGEIGLHGLETENEEIRVLCFPTAEAFALAASGRINNAPALVALLWLQANHARLRQEWKRA